MSSELQKVNQVVRTQGPKKVVSEEQNDFASAMLKSIMNKMISLEARLKELEQSDITLKAITLAYEMGVDFGFNDEIENWNVIVDGEVEDICSWYQIEESLDFENKLIQVCGECKKASCWYGIHYCGNYRTANLEIKTVAELREINAEHESYWSNKKMEEIYGCVAPFGYK